MYSGNYHDFSENIKDIFKKDILKKVSQNGGEHDKTSWRNMAK